MLIVECPNPIPYTILWPLFYTDLSVLPEEGELRDDARPYTTKTELRILDTRGSTTRTIAYSDLDREEKENVLTDLLVKSAINHALEKQKRVKIHSDTYM